MISKLLPLLVCMSLAGCAVFQPVTTSELANPEFQRKISPEEVAALPAGSRVEITYHLSNFDQFFVGTILHASPQGVALLNCEHSARSVHGVPVLSKVPYVSRLFKNTGVGRQRVPVQWVSIREMTTASVISPPPSDYVAPQLAIDTNDEPVFERIGVDFNFLVIGDQPQSNASVR